MSEQMLSKIKTGRVVPSASELAAIGAALDLDPSLLLRQVRIEIPHTDDASNNVAVYVPSHARRTVR